MNARSPLEAPVPESELVRFTAIARIAAAKGWGRYAERLGFGRHAGPAEGGGAISDAVRLREALEELGPTFVKLGQMMAGRTDIFPEDLVIELAKLHENVAAFPVDVARKIVEEEIGKPVSELYSSFDDSPMAAASMAQVHCATLPDGTSVIVKIQRPGIAATVEADISVLRRLARLLGTVMPTMRALNLPDLVERHGSALNAPR